MTIIGKTGRHAPGHGSWLTFTISVVGGTGSYAFPIPLHGKCYHRQITPPNGATYSFYVQNSSAIFHDTHVATGFADNNDVALWADEVSFYIVNADTDGTYTVTIWVG